MTNLQLCVDNTIEQCIGVRMEILTREWSAPCLIAVGGAAVLAIVLLLCCT